MLAVGLGGSSAAAPSTTTASEPEDEATIAGPTAIGFFPPITKEERDAENDGGLREAYSHLNFALEDLAKCLAPRKLMLRIKITRSLRVRNGDLNREYKFPMDWAHAIGIVLVTPGKEPEVVFATAGPSSLLELAPQAAWTYFSEPQCKRW